MTSISAASAQTYQSPLQKLQDELLSEVKSGAIKSSDQDALSSALTDIDSAMQASRASDQASGTRPSPDRTEIEDRRSDRRRSFQRQADQRSGHRTAGHLQGGLRQRSRRGWRSGAAAGGPPPGGPPPADGASSSDDTSSSTTRHRSTTFSSSSCNRCRNRCRLRHRRPTAQPAVQARAAAVPSRRC